MIAMKFGGSSVARADSIEKVKNIVVSTAEQHKKIVVVVSALGGVTDMLIHMAKIAESGDDSCLEMLDDLSYRHRRTAEALFSDDEMSSILPFIKEKTKSLRNLLNGVFLIKELSPRVLDCIVSYGELVSSFVISHYIKKFLPNTQFADSRMLVKTDSSFGAAKVNFEATNTAIRRKMDSESGIFVMGGFIASNEEEVTTTLGRGGSDYTAAIVAAALEVDELEIWTDVNGVMTADPRKVKQAFSLEQITYEEAMEMSHFGAKVIYPPTIQPVLDHNIPIRIRNTFQPEFPGTLISRHSGDDRAVKGVTSIGKIALMSVQGSGMVGVTGIAGRLFNALARSKVNIILITQASSEHSISFAVKPEDAPAAKTAIEEEFKFELRAHLLDEVEVEEDLSVLAIVGSKMKNTIGLSGMLFQALGKNGVNVRAIAQGSSELNISVVVGKADESKSLNALHEAFFLSDTKTIHLFLVGTGLIGATLLEQIQRQQAYLLDNHSMQLKLVAASNTRQMLFDEDGIEITNWKSELAEKGSKADLGKFVDHMVSLNLSNSIFVDCTASEYPVHFYENVLQNSISVVTPNKIANSGTLDNYLKLKHLANRYRVQFLYETNVGAGLPVITTLNDLTKSGDEINKIEAVLSGSLSFIFNNFGGEKTFSSIVKEAKERGYTEPDPREDLSGMDVARKVLILARETGQHIEMGDIDVQNILPEACRKAPTVDAFMEALKQNDFHFSRLRDEAESRGKELRFLATIEKGTAKVSLEEVDSSSPFSSLSGSDNMIVFTTARYNERPLVVKGPGAGAAVTAAGVFAEIIAVGNYLS